MYATFPASGTLRGMITGAHVLLYSKDPEADRTFFRDVLKFRAVDAGGGWLIFELAPAELALHPGGGSFVQRHGEEQLLGAVLYLMCDDLATQIRWLKARKVRCTRVMKAEWGSSTTFALPSGGRIGMYQPTHPTAIARPARTASRKSHPTVPRKSASR